MTPSQPSPRPWHYKPDDDGNDIIYDANGEQIARVHQGEPGDPELIIEAVNGHGVVSDEMVEAAARALAINHDGYGMPFDGYQQHYKDKFRADARIILVAALAARGGGEAKP
jgi:hypothetical protein